MRLIKISYTANRVKISLLCRLHKKAGGFFQKKSPAQTPALKGLQN